MLRLWFSFDVPIDRRTYFLNGLGLMVAKYAVDAAALKHFTGRTWTPLNYFNPLWDVRERLMGDAPQWFLPAMVVFALPFLWIGVSMSARRAIDAGMSAWWALVFFVPWVNFLLMGALSVMDTWPRREPEVVDQRLQSAMVGVAVVVIDTLITMLIAIYFRHQYSTGLFLGLPFTLGYISGYTYAKRVPDSAGSAVGVALAAVTVAGGATMMFALEGFICTAMALPLAWTIAMPGALVGRAVALRAFSFRPGVGSAAVFIPLVVAIEPAPAPGPRDVVTVVEIAAPPSVVWQHVVTFPELAPPTEWMFRAGLAAPVRARIDGSGVGAVRWCDFNTGSFREPITAWEENRLLAFDIVQQAPPLTELSPYGDIQPPHLAGYFRATHGEFRLIPLEGGRTRLVGTTRYEMHMGPRWYWNIYADWIVETIHLRVLRHIQDLSEQRG